MHTEGQKPPTSINRRATLKKEPAHPELSEMFKWLEENCTKRSAEETWLCGLDGLFLLVFGPAFDPHVGCRLELTLSKEKHLISLHIDHSWSTTHPRFKHISSHLLPEILHASKILGPQKCAETEWAFTSHRLETNRYQVGHVSVSDGNLVLIKTLMLLSLARIRTPLSLH